MLTQQELESRLWAAANSLRGPVDPTDFKAYVFPLFFFKWISDGHDEDRAKAVALYRSNEELIALAENYRFAIPDACHWDDLRKVSVNVGVALQNILDRLQQANPERLAAIFGDVAWGNTERLPEASLLNLIDTFNTLRLDSANVEGDVLGAAYEYLLERFADASGTKAGEFFTPRAVVRLLTRILHPQPEESVYDPACGSGGMLVEAISEVREAGGNPNALHLYGQEVNLTTSAIARMNLYIHGIEDAQIVRGDTLRSPRFVTTTGLQQFDCVLANPPFSLKNWGQESWGADPWKRSVLGVPPKGNADMAWVQHMVASMKPDTGRMAIVMPHGVLFRGGAEGRIRQGLIEAGVLEAVIGLPPNLFYSTSIPASVLVFRSRAREGREGVVQFIDASARFTAGRNQNSMLPHDVAAVVEAYRIGDDPDGDGGVQTRLVPMTEMAENGYDCNIGRYIRGAAAQVADVEGALAELRDARDALRAAEVRLDKRLREAGYAS
ncbi:MAG: class I SAM-dependent DNA methyltransferase [Chloroflexota bacterium]